MLDVRPILRNCQVFLQGRQCAIVLELTATVVVTGRFREHLDENHRIQNRVLLVVGELDIVANHHHVGVGIEAGWRYPQPQIAGVHLAALPLQLLP